MKLAVLTSYFNFARSASRRKVIDTFIQAMPKYIVSVIEAAMEGLPFDIPYASRQIRVSEPLWFKENLLNILWRAMPPEYDAFAFVDCDLVFDRPDVIDATKAELDRHAAVQMFSSLRWQRYDGKEVPYVKAGRTCAISVAARNAGLPADKWIVDPVIDHPGGAWAFRRNVLEKIDGWYDRYPGGSNDVFTVVGLYGAFDAKYLDQYDKPMRRDVLKWARPAFEVVNGKVGVVEGAALHLWHGESHHRFMSERHQVFKDNGFDPELHLCRSESGLWQLSEACPIGIREWMREYMTTLRREDEKPRY